MWSARQTRKMGRRVAGLLGGLLVGLLLAAAPAAAAFVDPINLSNSASISESPAIAVNGAGQVFAAWREGNEILFRYSQPTQGSCGGLKFEAPVSLSAGTGTASRPAVAAVDYPDGSRGVFVAWQGQQPLANSEVWFSRSTDGGQNFLPAVNLSKTPGASTSPSVAADNLGGVFVAWSDGSLRREILFLRSTDFGATFGPAANLSRTQFVDSGAPTVATDGSNVFLAWQEGNSIFNSAVLYKKFGRDALLADVAGPASTIAPTTNLSAGLGSAFGSNLAFGDGILSVAFGSLNGPSVYHRLLGNGDPAAFSAPENLSGSMLEISTGRAARRNGSAMVAWAQQPPTDTATEIEYWLRVDITPPEQALVSRTPGASSLNPAVAMDSTGRLLVAWQETVNLNGVLNDEIYLSYSGGTGGDPMDATVWADRRVLKFPHMGRGDGERHRDGEDGEESHEGEDAEENHEREDGKHRNVTLFIELPDRSAADINLGTLKVNGQSVVPAKSKVGDKNHNGIPDLKLKFKFTWSELRNIFDGTGLTAARRDGNFTVTGNTNSGGCFSGSGKVRIKR